ncbi:hypothetical protein BJV77DRAFT_940137, partial [Russula vinacea]
VFSNNWVARDIQRTALKNMPFEAMFPDSASSTHFQPHFHVHANPAGTALSPFYQPSRVRFHMARLVGEFPAGNCSLIYWEAGRVVSLFHKLHATE